MQIHGTIHMVLALFGMKFYNQEIEMTMETIKAARKDNDGDQDLLVQESVEVKAIVKNARKAAKASAKDSAKLRAESFSKARDAMRNPHISSQDFCAAAWMKIHCKDGNHRAKVLIRSGIDAQREWLAYRRFAPVQPW